jgi:hypothetical protein
VKLRKESGKLKIKFYVLFYNDKNNCEGALLRVLPLAHYFFKATDYCMTSKISWIGIQPTLHFEWKTLRCLNLSKNEIEVNIMTKIKISWLKAYRLNKILRSTYSVSLISVDSENNKKPVPIAIFGNNMTAEGQENIANMTRDYGGATAPLCEGPINEEKAKLEEVCVMSVEQERAEARKFKRLYMTSL